MWIVEKEDRNNIYEVFGVKEVKEEIYDGYNNLSRSAMVTSFLIFDGYWSWVEADKYLPLDEGK
jgi:hypothetical protein